MVDATANPKSRPGAAQSAPGCVGYASEKSIP